MLLIIGLISGSMSLITVYITVTINDNIDGQQFFILLTFTHLISGIIGSLPTYITSLVVGYNSIKRVQPFLRSKEVLFL